MNKLISFSLISILLPLITSAQAVSYSCQPSKVFSPAIQIKNDKIMQVKSLSIPATTDLNEFKVEAVMTITTMLDEMNSPKGKAPAKDIPLTFKLKEMKSGSLFELDTSVLSEAKLDALFLELGNFDVNTAGPVPDGIYPLKISLGLVSSRFSEKDPMLLKKIVLDCSVNIQN